MGNPDEMTTGLISRTSRLLNSATLSDVEFRVRDADGAFQTFYAHKLILAMASKEFANMHYSNTDSPKVHKILDSSPSIIYMMLEYLYTDKLNLGNMEDAYRLYHVASQYGIDDLMKVCQEHIQKDQITLDNLFARYEYAATHNFHNMLQICRDLVCSNTMAVLGTKSFLETTTLVVKDILRQDLLNVEEKELIYAVLRWCGRECRRKNRPVDSLCLRDAMNPLLMHMRFLCLTAEQFCDLTEEYDIFTSAESAILTRKILSPGCNAKIPGGFCAITRQRGLITKNNNINQLPMKNNTDINQLPMMQPVYNTSNLQPLQGKTSPPLYSYQKSQTTPEVETSNIFQFSSFNKKPESPQPAKSEMASMYPKKAPPVVKVLPQTCGVQKVYDFPLQEMQKGLHTAMENDIKCSAIIKMTKGSILVHGVELRVAESRVVPDECLDVFSCITINSQPRSNSHSLKLKNNTLSLQFQDPIRVSTHPVDIEITIENIKLNRCSICREQTAELNCGLTYSAEISLKSNQVNFGDYIFFLISRIIYSTN